jgi:hypothetical protein
VVWGCTRSSPTMRATSATWLIERALFLYRGLRRRAAHHRGGSGPFGPRHQQLRIATVGT